MTKLIVFSFIISFLSFAANAANDFEISNVLGDATPGTSLTASGIVVSTNSRGFVLQDNSGTILVYVGSSFNYESYPIGTQVNLTGDVTVFGGVMELTNSTYVIMGDQRVELPAPTVINGDDMEKVITGYDTVSPYYVSFTGKTVISGSYVNIEMDGDGSSAMGSLFYATPEARALLKEGEIQTFTGYYVQKSAGKYFNISVNSIDGTTLNSIDNIKMACGNIADYHKLTSTMGGRFPITMEGEVTVVYQNGPYLYLEDPTGHMLVLNTANIEIPKYSPGDVITGFTGQYFRYISGRSQMAAIAGFSAPVRKVDSPKALLLDKAEYINEANVNRYVALHDAHIEIDPENERKMKATWMGMNQEEMDITLYNEFNGPQFDPSFEFPGKDYPFYKVGYDIMGFLTVYNGELELYPNYIYSRAISVEKVYDITPQIKVVNGIIDAPEGSHVFDMWGKECGMSPAPGIYVVRSGSSSTKVIVR